MKVKFSGYEAHERLDQIHFSAEVGSDWQILEINIDEDESDMDLWDDLNQEKMMDIVTDYLQEILDFSLEEGGLEYFLENYVLEVTAAPEAIYYID